MKKYRDFQPSLFDAKGLNSKEVGADWLVVLSQNRDSDCLELSNFRTALQTLGGESADLAVHRFGHWAYGWFEIIVVRPGSEAEALARDIEDRMENYPVLDEEDFSNLEREHADMIWRDCYSMKDRIAYVRENRRQFEFSNFGDMLSCLRGKYFAGYASELI